MPFGVRVQISPIAPSADYTKKDMLNRNLALKQLQNEINDVAVYSLLETNEKNPENKKILRKIINEEKRHYDFCAQLTNEKRSANLLVVFFYVVLTKIFGVSFALKFMEMREQNAESFYLQIIDEYPQAKEIYEQESNHEKFLISMLKDPALTNAGAIVLGMNDALVELTGTLSGIALAYSNAKVVGATGFIIGVAAALSMAGSAYLESKENPSPDVKPFTYSLYTGVSYIATTAILIAPFFVFDNIVYAICAMLAFALITILLYNFYICVAKELKFAPRVAQMCAITFGVALISFLIGFLVKKYFGLEI